MMIDEELNDFLKVFYRLKENSIAEDYGFKIPGTGYLIANWIKDLVIFPPPTCKPLQKVNIYVNIYK